MSGAKSVVINTRPDEGFLLQPKDLEAALTPATRILVLCNPSNPTGAVHPPALLEQLAEVLRKWPRVVRRACPRPDGVVMSVVDERQ